jgi:hypothetical protein
MTQRQETNRRLAYQHFGRSLAMIEDPAIAGKTVNVLACLAPGHFWTIPASTSGKYHPPQARDASGLVWHSNYAVQWGIRLFKQVKDNHPLHAQTTLRDELIQCLILHDLYKNGRSTLTPHRGGQWPKGPTGITATHGGLLAADLTQKDDLGIRGPAIRAIGGHMGLWTDPDYISYWADAKTHMGCTPYEVDLVWLVHQADFCAAQDFGGAE